MHWSLPAARFKAERLMWLLAVGCGSWITEIPMYEMEGLGILVQVQARPGIIQAA